MQGSFATIMRSASPLERAGIAVPAWCPSSLNSPSIVVNGARVWFHVTSQLSKHGKIAREILRSLNASITPGAISSLLTYPQAEITPWKKRYRFQSCRTNAVVKLPIEKQADRVSAQLEELARSRTTRDLASIPSSGRYGVVHAVV